MYANITYIYIVRSDFGSSPAHNRGLTSSIIHPPCFVPFRLMGRPTSLTCPRPRKAKLLKVAAPCGVLYWVQIRYRDASTQWKFVTRWTKRTRPSPIPECCEKKLSKDRLGAWQSQHMMEVYLEEVLAERPNVYLHS